MAVQPTDLLEPTGDLVPDLFPGKDADAVAALLAAYIADGTSRVPSTLAPADQDRAVTAWAYARAYRNVLARLSRTPATVSLANEGSTTMLGEQLRTFKQLAARYDAEYTLIVGDAPSPEDTPSASATNSYVW
jgi:hypothetical protein